MPVERVRQSAEIPNFDNALCELRNQAINPPGGDRSIGSCYQAVSDMLGKDELALDRIKQIYEKRASFTPSHFVNLFFRAVQFIRLYHHQDSSHKGFSRIEEWQPILTEVVTGSDFDKLREILLHRDTTTTKFQRYSGPKIVLSAVFGDREIKVADLGCGANHGLPGIEIGEPFEHVEDRSVEKELSLLLSRELNIAEGLAVDKQNPENPEVQAWIIACSFYPQELGQLELVDKLEKKLKASKKTVFVKEDLLKPSGFITESYFDATIVSTVLYQHSGENRAKILDEAKRITSDGGIIIVQDFAKKNGDASGLTFDGTWMSNGFGYRTFVLSKSGSVYHEALRWSDGRCRQVQPGEDWNFFKKLNILSRGGDLS